MGEDDRAIARLARPPGRRFACPLAVVAGESRPSGQAACGRLAGRESWTIGLRHCARMAFLQKRSPSPWTNAASMLPLKRVLLAFPGSKTSDVQKSSVATREIPWPIICTPRRDPRRERDRWVSEFGHRVRGCRVRCRAIRGHDPRQPVILRTSFASSAFRHQYDQFHPPRQTPWRRRRSARGGTRPRPGHGAWGVP